MGYISGENQLILEEVHEVVIDLHPDTRLTIGIGELRSNCPA